jgi:AcrR family transcriptional regulator
MSPSPRRAAASPAAVSPGGAAPQTPAPGRGAGAEPGRRERQRLETRSRLYEAAVAEFRQTGFARAQIEHIAERAGVARGTFYFHFPTKEHVLLEMQRRYEVRIVERFRDLAPRAGSVASFLESVIEAIAAEGGSVGDPALSRELVAMYVREPRHLDLSTEPLVVALVDWFGDAQERGEVRSDLAPEDIANIFLTALFGFVVGAVDSIESRLGEFRLIIDVFARGIAP